MAVAYDAASESHTGTTGAASVASFTWNHVGGASARGALVFVFSIGALTDTGVTYGGVAMTAIPYTSAVTSGENGAVRAYYLDNCGTGTKAVVVNRTNNTVVTYAVCYTVTAAYATAVYLPGVKTQAGATVNTAASSTSAATGTAGVLGIDDGSPGSGSVRFMGQYYGGSNVLAAGTGSTAGPSIDFGLYVIGTYRETTAGQGSRNVGSAAGTDDLAVVALAVAETGIPITGTSAVAFDYSDSVYGAQGASGTYEAEVLKDSPASYWRLGESSGDFNDFSGNPTRALVPSGTIARGLSPLITQAGDGSAGFSVGPDGFARTSGSSWWAAGTQLTLEAWVVLTNIAGYTPIAGARAWVPNTANLGWTQLAGTTTVECRIGTTSAEYDANVTLAAGVPYHLVTTWDGSYLRTYVNGVLAGGPTATAGTCDPSYDFALNVNGANWVGSPWLDEVAAYTTALSAARITAHFVAGSKVFGTAVATFGFTGVATGRIPIVVLPPSVALVLTGAVPVVTTAASVVALPGLVALTLTGAVPWVQTPVVVSPVLDDLYLTGAVPAVWTPLRVQPAAAVALVLTGAVPAVWTPRLAQPAAVSLALTGAVPAVWTPVLVLPVLGDLYLTGAVPFVLTSASASVVPGAASLVLTGAVPLVLVPRVVQPGLFALVATGVVPAVVLGSVALPGVVALTLTGAVPAVWTPRVAQPTVASLVLTGAVPAVLAPRVSVPGGVALVLSGAVPLVWSPCVAQPASVSLILTGVVPVIGVGVVAIPGALSLVFTGAVPFVFGGCPMVVAPGSLSLLVSGVVPGIAVGRFAQPSAGVLVLAGAILLVRIAPTPERAAYDRAVRSSLMGLFWPGGQRAARPRRL